MRRWMFLVLVVVLVACGDTSQTSVPTTGSAATPVDGPTPAVGEVDRSKLSKELKIFIWGEYLPTEGEFNIADQFEQEYGVELVVDTYASNEEMAAKVRAGNSGYDLVGPSDYMVATLAEGGYLAPLNKANLPNYANLSPENLGLYYDAQNTYSVPYLWGTTGIAYNKNEITPAPEGWAALFDPALLEPAKGRITMLDDEREAIGAALRFLGKDQNSSDPADLEEAKTALLTQKPFLAKYTSENVYQDLAAGEIVLAQAWSGDAGLAILENPAIGWVIPKEGSVIWQDNLAIVKDSPNQYTAEVFINYTLRPEVAAKIANFTGFLTPNTKARALVSAELQELYTTLEPDTATRQRLDWLRKGENASNFSDVWSSVKSQ